MIQWPKNDFAYTIVVFRFVDVCLCVIPIIDTLSYLPFLSQENFPNMRCDTPFKFAIQKRQKLNLIELSWKYCWIIHVDVPDHQQKLQTINYRFNYRVVPQSTTISPIILWWAKCLISSVGIKTNAVAVSLLYTKQYPPSNFNISRPVSRRCKLSPGWFLLYFM